MCIEYSKVGNVAGILLAHRAAIIDVTIASDYSAFRPAQFCPYGTCSFPFVFPIHLTRRACLVFCKTRAECLRIEYFLAPIRRAEHRDRLLLFTLHRLSIKYKYMCTTIYETRDTSRITSRIIMRMRMSKPPRANFLPSLEYSYFSWRSFILYFPS